MISVRVRPELLARLDRMAARERMDRSELVREALRAGLALSRPKRRKLAK